MYDISRVWLLFASKYDNIWECLQVAQSKKVKDEIEDVIKFLFEDEFNKTSEHISFTDSAFYKEVCPKNANKSYEYNRKLLYSKIGCEYKNFRICFLNVDKYLRIEPTNINKTDADRITEICKNQYAEAKIAFETLAVYWNHYRSGIDGQTIVYIASHTSEFQE